MLTVYSRPGCVQCIAIKRWLAKPDRELTEGTEYIIKDVSTSEYDLEFVKGLGYEAAPVVVLPDGSHFYGFDDQKLADWHAGL